MKKHGRTLMAMTMAVAMATAAIGSMIPANGITAEAASIKLSKTSLKMKVGQSKQLKVKGTKKKVKWSVSNGKIVKVTQKGKVTAKKAGSAKVIAKVSGKKLTCKVKVAASENAKVTATPSTSPTATATATAAPASTMTGNTSSTSSSSSSSSSSKTTSTPKVTSTQDPSATIGASIKPTATNEAQETEKPENTKKPGKTDAPDATKAPSELEDPDATKEPSESEDPKTTKEPSESKVPKTTKEPSESEDLKTTKEPSESEDPDTTKEPSESEDPDATKAPNETEDPDATKAPQKTEKPDATDAPAQGDVTEIKVGDTKTVTVNGVKFTYTATTTQVIVKMENNSEIPKKVRGSISLLNEKGEVLNEDSFLYRFSIEYLEAGQTYYDYVYNYDAEEEVSSYSVNDVEVGAVDSYSVGCLKDIKVTPDKGIDVENPKITLEYTGDTSALNGEYIYVYGSIVYYDSEDNIVELWGIYEDIMISDENNTLVLDYLAALSEEAVRYEIVLSGAEYIDYSYDNEY